jgi:uncharacterized protein YbjQ (UPF0145 family)
MATGTEGASRVSRTPTSDLSVAEAAALRRVGLSGIGFVMGTVAMQLASSSSAGMGNLGIGRPGMGAVYPGPGPSLPKDRYARYFPCTHGYVTPDVAMEHQGFSVQDRLLETSFAEGYRVALARLHEEALALGAHGVVGVRITVEHLAGSLNDARFLATGTAVVHPGSAPLPTPFTTNASGRHFERLIGLGYVPVALAVGIGIVRVFPNCTARGISVAGPNRQIPEAFGAARQQARTSLGKAALALGDGVVHTEWSDRRARRVGEAWDQTVSAIGTVVRRFAASGDLPLPQPVVPLRP